MKFVWNAFKSNEIVWKSEILIAIHWRPLESMEINFNPLESIFHCFATLAEPIREPWGVLHLLELSILK